MFSLYKNLDGYFSDEPVKFIQTSDITAYIKDPDGAFQCPNVKCLNDWIRYKPLLKRKIPDFIKCPKCQHWMVNSGLENLWGQSVDDLRKSESGTPQIYQKALTGCAIFKRLCRAYLLVDPQDNIRQVAEIPSFDIILDIGAIIFDKTSITNVAEIIDQFRFDNYTKSSISSALEHLKQYHSFYEAMLQGKTYAQVDLKKKMLTINPPISDPTRVFYVWSNFGFLHREKIKNRIYFTK